MPITNDWADYLKEEYKSHIIEIIPQKLWMNITPS